MTPTAGSISLILVTIISWALFNSSVGYLGSSSFTIRKHGCGNNYVTSRYCSSQQGGSKSGSVRTSAARPGLLSKKLLSRQVAGRSGDRDKTESGPGRQEVGNTVVSSTEHEGKRTAPSARVASSSNRDDGKAKLKTKESPTSQSTAATTSASSSASEPLVAVSEEFRVAIKDLRKINAPKKILRLVSDHAAAGTITQNMTVHAFRTLQRMNRSDLSLEMVPIWHQAVDIAHTGASSADNRESELQGQESCVGVMEIEPAAALIRSCCKLQRFDLADGIASKAGIIVRSGRSNTRELSSANVPVSDAQLAALTVFLPELAVGYATVGSLEKALSALEMMRKHSILIDIELSKQIMKGFLKQASVEDIRRCLRALLALDGLGDNDSHQLLTSTFMRTIDFVKGAVSMDTLPPGECPEAAFIGRSNVGEWIMNYEL
jgi:hypothetical protein